ncbi:uncharacterized protein FFB14_00735 [Fusarium fujikuroi]|nr:uncharacterized protein FFB14_00735 [Fusarium fujikuroi]
MSNYFILGDGRYQLLLSLGKAYLLDTLAVAHRHTLYAINSTGARSANILGHMFAGVADNVMLGPLGTTVGAAGAPSSPVFMQKDIG